MLNTRARAWPLGRLAARRYPDGPSKTVRKTVGGFVAGVNAYLRRTGVAHLPDPTCRGKKWVRPITTMDMRPPPYALAERWVPVDRFPPATEGSPPALRRCS